MQFVSGMENRAGFPHSGGIIGSPLTVGTGQVQTLSPEEFESLNKSVQLLRISQLRYIVQKFSIPASGNKMKLLSLVMSVFQSLRYDRILIDVLQEINKLIAQQNDPFIDPLASYGILELVAPDPTFSVPPNPLFAHNRDFVFGPIGARVGMSKGSFQFAYPDQLGTVAIAFLFPNGNPRQFTFMAELNGAVLEVSGDDPYPQMLDVSSILQTGGARNVMDVKLIECDGPMLIGIVEYRQNSVHGVAAEICGRSDIDLDRVTVVSKRCAHEEPFLLVPFMSCAFSTGNWNCPLCCQQIELGSIVCKEMQDPRGRMQPAEVVVDPFTGGFDWEGC